MAHPRYFLQALPAIGTTRRFTILQLQPRPVDPVLDDLKRASARTQVALGAELPEQLHELGKVDRLWPIEMDESHDIVDIGVNLPHRSFQKDREEVIQRAFAAGVRTMVITGTSLVSSEAALRIAREFPNQLFATAGVHPNTKTAAEFFRIGSAR